MKKLDYSFLIFGGIVFIVYGACYLLTGNGIPCFINELTGLYCPGCGISRMLISLAKFEFYQAFRFNPLLFILLPIVGIVVLIQFVYYYKNKKFFKINNAIYITLLVVIVLFGILRNIPAFSYLIPTVVK